MLIRFLSRYFLTSISITAVALSIAACNKSSDSGQVAVPPATVELTKDNYLSGKQFCQTYASVTSAEYGQYVTVPKDYDHPEKGSLQLYVYSLSPFDAKKPSYMYVDGGPGQNAHGLMLDLLGGTMNELRFDQRGLGCSAPDTWEEYSDVSLYSSKNNVRDMEEIRKALKIEKWTVYGLSYGTVPATMYSSSYTDHVTSTVLEGVVGGANFMDHETQSIDRDHYNKVWNSLNDAQKKSFASLMADPQGLKDMAFLLHQFGDYEDDAIPQVIQVVHGLIKDDGSIDQGVLGKLNDLVNQQQASTPHPQAPGAVDSNILTIIYCKNLGAMETGLPHVAFDSTSGFTIATSSDDASDCSKKGVKTADVDEYEPTNFPIKNPVYYFQGQMDGATPAKGALHHRSVVPQGQSYFLLATQGGHNPNLKRIHSGDSSNSSSKQESQAELFLFSEALNAKPMTAEDVGLENIYMPDGQAWRLYLTQDSVDPAAVVAAIHK